jgi:hypothetical protein
MNEKDRLKSEIENELHNLRHNLEGFFTALWESEERQQIQDEIKDQLKQLGETLDKAANDLSQSDTGKQIRADIEDIRRRYESGELREKGYAELMNVLKRINLELESASRYWKKPQAGGEK